ncbi:hypothetical protein AK88_02293 [Plasmodium fragile]|uniref:Uncharacterized protein n=1 Tax=Plasmodium fragile TaxID=5857 RepID=A0A0D9QM39_PLAFR|nr:uncharacterized protein AK88_02293 [Plasmodium fragile]KJP88018.1 hypothetical protein AK88_02293 [Plasmodium fragile]
MKGKGKSTDAPKGGKATKSTKAKRPTRTTKGKAQNSKKGKQGNLQNIKQPCSDESDVYFYNDLQRWTKTNVKVPIWLKKPKDIESTNEFYKNVIKKLLRVKNKIRAYQIEEAYLIDCLRKCLMDLNLNSIRSLDYVNYEMLKKLCEGDYSAFFKNGENNKEEDKCLQLTKEQDGTRDSQKDLVHEPILKDGNCEDQTTHNSVDCPTGKVTPLPGEDIKCLIESLKNALSVEKSEKEKDIMKHVFNKVIIPGAFFENNNFCPIFMNLLKLDIYNSCCLSGTELGPKLTSLIELLNNFDEGMADGSNTGEKQEGVPSASNAGTQHGDAKPGGAHNNESEENSYKEDRLFFKSQTSLFKLSQYCIEKGIVDNHQVASFDTIYIYSGKESQHGGNQSPFDKHKYKNKKKKLFSHGNLKYSLDITKKKNESLHFINEQKDILESNSTRRSINHPHVERHYDKNATPVREENGWEGLVANESVACVKAKESPHGRELLPFLSHFDEKEELPSGGIATAEKEAISVVASVNETEQSFVSAVSKFDCEGSHSNKCRTIEGCKEDPHNYLHNDWLQFDEGGNVVARAGLDEEFLHGSNTNKCETPRKVSPPTGRERFRLYKENEQETGDQGVDLPLQVCQEDCQYTDSNTMIRKRKLHQTDHSSQDKTQPFQYNTFELYMDNGQIKKNKRLDSINEFEDVPIEVNNCVEKSHDSRCSDVAGTQVRFLLEGSEVGCGRGTDEGSFTNKGSNPLDWDELLNRNDHVTSSIGSNLPSAFPSSGYSQAYQDSDTSVIIERINYDRKKGSDSDGAISEGVNAMKKLLPRSTTRPKCSAAAVCDFSTEKKGHINEEDKNLISIIDRFCDDSNLSGVIDVHDYLKSSLASHSEVASYPVAASHSEVIILEDNDEVGDEDKRGEKSAKDMHDRAGRKWGEEDNPPQMEKCTPWRNPPGRDEADTSIAAATPKTTKEREGKKELSILNIDIEKMNNVVLEGLLDFFGMKANTLSRKKQITELAKIQSYLNEQYENMLKECNTPSGVQKDNNKLRKGTSVEGDCQTENGTCSYHHDGGKGDEGRMCANGGSSSSSGGGVSNSMSAQVGDGHTEAQCFFLNEEWFDGALVGEGKSTDQASTTQMISNEVGTTHRSPPHPLNDDQAKSQEDYLNRMKKKIKQMELKSLFERIDEAIGVNEVLHDHIKRDKQIEYSLLKQYLVDCKLSVNREIVMSYCKDKDIQVVMKKRAKV